jgi:DNA-binding MarR family transcriptional regulator
MKGSRTLPLDIVSNLNDTHVKIIEALEESEAENYRKGVPGESISDLAEDLDLKSNTISERVTELQEMNLVKKNKSEFSEKSVVIRPSDHYDAVLGNRKTYMNENGTDF